jgi:hypothetical protein
MELIEFRMLKNSLPDEADAFLERSSDGRVTLMSDMLSAIRSLSDAYGVSGMLERFWDMFVVDAFIGNKDRNNGNWGLLSRKGEIMGLAPVYDNGNSFFNKRRASMNGARAPDSRLVEQDAVGTAVSVYRRDDGRHVKPFDYIGEELDADCNAALSRFMGRIDMAEVMALVDSIPESALNFDVLDRRMREFTKKILIERYDKALLPAWEKIQSR